MYFIVRVYLNFNLINFDILLLSLMGLYVMFDEVA